MTSTSSAGSSLITLRFALDLSLDVAEQEVQAAINAAASFLPKDLPDPPVYSKVNPADAPVLTLALTSESLAAAQGRGPRRDAPGAEDRGAPRRRAGEHRRRPASGGAHPRQPDGARRLRPHAGGRARRRRGGQRQPGQGQFRRPAQSYTIAANDQLLTERRVRAARHRLPQRRARPAVRRGRRRRRRRERPSRRRG